MKNYTYEKSGVSLKNAGKLNKILSKNFGCENIQKFAGILDLPEFEGYSLAAATDGIGTKIIPLYKRKMFNTMARDLAAMNLNDIVCTGAKPLLFLDYIATNTLNPKEISTFILELRSVLKQYNCTLLGGETSEMGNFIQKGAFDAAGFAVGIIKNENAIKPENVRKDDIVIGLKSTGAHSNGFTLIRKLYEDKKLTEVEFTESLAPTEIYANEIVKITGKNLATGLANITGGGILENLKRTIPKGLTAILNRKALPEINIYNAIEKFTDKEEMFGTFNMGAGFAVITRPENLDENLKILEKFSPFIFGKIENAKDDKKCKFKN